MPVDDFEIAEWVHNLLAEINLDDFIRAGTNLTIRELNYLVHVAKGGEFDIDTITNLWREVNKLSGAGTVITAGALVILVIMLCHPRVVSRPVLNALRVTAVGVTAGMFPPDRLISCVADIIKASVVFKVQSHWSVKPLLGLLEKTAMRRYGGPSNTRSNARSSPRASTTSDYFGAFKLWAQGNLTPSSKR